MDGIKTIRFTNTGSYGTLDFMLRRAWSAAPREIRLLLCTSVLMGLGFYSLIPYLTLHLTGSLAWSMTLVGACLAIRQLSQQGLSFFGGAIADRFGHKRMLVIGIWIRAAGFFCFAFADTPAAVFFAAILSGLGGALFDPAGSAIYESFLPVNGREPLIALRNVANNVAFATSALLGNLLLHLDFAFVSRGSAVLYVLAGLAVWRFLPRPMVAGRLRAPLALLRVATDRPFVIYTLFLTGFYYLWTQLYYMVPRAVVDATGQESSLTLVYGLVSLSVVFLQLPMTARLRSVHSRFRLIATGIFFMGLGLAAIPFLPGKIGLAASSALFATGLLIAGPLPFELVPRFAPRELLATYYGFTGYAAAFGGAASALLGGHLYDLGASIGVRSLPSLVSLVIAIMVAAGFLWLERRAFAGRVAREPAGPGDTALAPRVFATR